MAYAHQSIYTVVPQKPQRHTRSSQSSPLLERREDIDKLTGKHGQNLLKSSLVVESATPATPVFEEEQAYQKLDTPSTVLQQRSSIEVDLEAAFGGQQEHSEFDSLSSRDTQSEETVSTRSSTDAEVSWFGDPLDAEGLFLRRSGYTVPLDNELLAAIQAVLGREAAIKMASIKSSSGDFKETLTEDRNVVSEETVWADPKWKHLNLYHYSRETGETSITTFLDELWREDLSFIAINKKLSFN